MNLRCLDRDFGFYFPQLRTAERNVLPTLNNLLENREMALDDGRFLVASERYDALLKSYTAEEMTRRKARFKSDACLPTPVLL